ncbi:Protein of unknown function [Cotesia congregata]|uniref:Uncharacterized protein n=1 Tax=Cotesia congregata TaxID=51543 RepID=A0A8J2HN75_COTCN|nr:Protein of unknown function [Cotesia congregata]
MVKETKEHGLKLNLNKTVAIILGSTGKLRLLNIASLPPIVIDGIALPYVTTIKCLGLTVSNNLSWKNHVSNTGKKVNSALYSLKKMYFDVPKDLQTKRIM